MSLVVPFDEIFANKEGLLANHPTWTRTELENVCRIINGFPFKSALFNRDKGCPVVRIRDISKNVTETRFDGEVPKEALIDDGDMLIGMDGNFRCYEWKGGKAGLNQRVCKIVADERFINRKFLLFGINGYLKAIEDATSSVTVGHLSSLDVLRIPFPLPPLAEQKRIVAKVEKLLAKGVASRARLEKVSVLLKRFRQSVLTAACSGRLTADWRGENPRVESGANLLVRIKQARLVAAVNAKETRQIDAAFHGAKLSVEASELGIEQFPDSWVACQIGTIGSVVNGSTPSRMHDEYWNGKIPWVSSGEVRNNIISETRERITQSGYDNCSVNLLPCGSVLLAMIGEGKTRGQSAILQVAATINQNIAAVLIPHGLVLSEFLWRWFLFQYDATREQGSGSGPQALNCQRVRELPFVLPPLAEQKEIVRRVEELFALADRLEARVAKARGQVDKLTQSILAKAFRGELVPQDPNDEPAEKLLARIRAATGPVAVQGGKVATTSSVRRGRPRKAR